MYSVFRYYTSMSQLIGIQIAADKGLPMKALESVIAVEGVGLEGDRYAEKKGSWSKVRVEVPRDVSLIESEVIEELSKIIPVTFSLSRRNLLSQGIHLNDAVGKRLQIGEVILEGIELCAPCARPGILSGVLELREKLEAALQNKGGLRAKVIKGGVLHVGDEIHVL